MLVCFLTAFMSYGITVDNIDKAMYLALGSLLARNFPNKFIANVFNVELDSIPKIVFIHSY